MSQVFSDVRDKTYKTRINIGFNNAYARWQREPAIFTRDTLVIDGHPVMERWEDSYMQELADIATSNGGIVLEVGFGMGISAAYIQKKPITEHKIIEANEDVFTQLKRFAKRSAYPVTPLFGFWQTAITALPDDSVDGILFDTYPLTEAEIHKNHFDFFKHAYRILKPGGVLTYYSDEISDFTPEHRAKLTAAGFNNIDKKICPVTPPKDCQYWTSDTIVAPIIKK